METIEEQAKIYAESLMQAGEYTRSHDVGVTINLLLAKLEAYKEVVEKLHGLTRHNPEMWATDLICHIIDGEFNKLNNDKTTNKER